MFLFVCTILVVLLMEIGGFHHGGRLKGGLCCLCVRVQCCAVVRFERDTCLSDWIIIVG